MRALLCVVVLMLAGCNTTPATQYITTPLPLPPRPELPALRGDQLRCLTDDTYRALVQRDHARRDYAEQLEAIIRSTHGDGKP